LITFPKIFEIWVLGFGAGVGFKKNGKIFYQRTPKRTTKKSGLPAVHNFSMHKLAADIPL
jgi:hypothetical protein